MKIEKNGKRLNVPRGAYDQTYKLQGWVPVLRPSFGLPPVDDDTGADVGATNPTDDVVIPADGAASVTDGAAGTTDAANDLPSAENADALQEPPKDKPTPKPAAKMGGTRKPGPKKTGGGQPTRKKAGGNGQPVGKKVDISTHPTG